VLFLLPVYIFYLYCVSFVLNIKLYSRLLYGLMLLHIPSVHMQCLFLRIEIENINCNELMN